MKVFSLSSSHCSSFTWREWIPQFSLQVCSFFQLSLWCLSVCIEFLVCCTFYQAERRERRGEFTSQKFILSPSYVLFCMFSLMLSVWCWIIAVGCRYSSVGCPCINICACVSVPEYIACMCENIHACWSVQKSPCVYLRAKISVRVSPCKNIRACFSVQNYPCFYIREKILCVNVRAILPTIFQQIEIVEIVNSLTVEESRTSDMYE